MPLIPANDIILNYLRVLDEVINGGVFLYRVLIYGLFLLSGATSLIYQVLWTRLLTLTFGVTTLAISTVLTSFFGGLALGSFFGGRWADKHGDGFKWYGVAEIIIGVYALLFMTLLGANNFIYVKLAQLLNTGFYGQNLIKFILAAILLIIPTTMMGATLPILSRTLADRWSRFAKDIGNLYAVNTTGAVIGAILTAFVLIPTFGIEAIIYTVGVVNIVMGAVAVYSNRFVTEAASADGFDEVSGAVSNSSSEASAEEISPGFARLIILGFAASGFTALAYEVIWSRVLGFILTGTVYAFATVLAVFLTGIAVGSFVVSRYIDRLSSVGKTVNLLAMVEVLIGLTSTALIILYAMMPEFDFYHRITATQNFTEFIYLNFMTSFILLFIPAFLFGTTFPLVCKIYSRSTGRVGESIGNVYSLNTVGGILGSFAGGFLLIHFMGMQTSLLLMGAINVLIGILFFLYNPLSVKSRSYIYTGVTVGAAIVITLLLPANMPRALHESLLRPGERMLFYAEGPSATVMIAEKEGAGLKFSNKRLWVNGNMATAAYYEGLQINRFQGVLPFLMHPDPKELLVICFGSGTTFGTLSQFDVERVDNVDIAKTVIKGAPFFKSENRDVINNPVSNIIIDDGRSYLEVTDKKYDVITEEPMHPSLAGVVNLYTTEYYELAKRHLKPGGIMSQWIPLYNLSVEDVRMLVKTFQSVFPHTTIWIASSDIFMIGSEEKQTVDYQRILDRLKKPNIKKLLTEIDLEEPIELLATFLMNEDKVREYAAGAEAIGDDMPLVEFTGPRSLAVNTISPNIAELVKYREPVLPYLRFTGADAAALERLTGRVMAKYPVTKLNLIGRAYYADGNIFEADKYYTMALEIDPTDRNSIHHKKKFKGMMRLR